MTSLPCFTAVGTVRRAGGWILPRLLALSLALAAPWGLSRAADAASAATPSAIEAQARALSRANAAVVGVVAEAVADATSAGTLGPLRIGSGVQIGSDGLVLTIGYLILEAEHVDLLLDDGRSVPARVVAYDLATGFGLLQSLAPLGIPVAPLGDAAAIRPEEPLVVASGGEQPEVSVAQMVSRRPFSGYWEYHVDSALFTVPPRADHSGAALFNGRGELVGIGSLLVADALGGDRPVSGNMFVPVDLLKPILGELRERGRSRASERAWMGLNCLERGGQVLVARVSENSPAEVAGLRAGDRIERIDGTEVRDLASLWKALWRGPTAEREVTLEIRRDDQRQTYTVQAVDRMKTLRRPQGI